MNDAALILAQLKAELAILKSELDKCLKDFDYENAHIFQKTIRLKSMEINAIERRLQKNYAEIQRCKLNIKMNRSYLKRIEDQLQSDKIRQANKKYLLEQHEEYNQEQDSHLEELTRLKNTNYFFQVDSDIVIEEVERLLDSGSKMLCLELNDDGLLNYITIEHLETRLILEYVNANIRAGNRRMHSLFNRRLIRMGFEKNDSYVWTLSLDRNNINTDKLLVILSSIVFEIIVPTNSTKCNLFILDV